MTHWFPVKWILAFSPIAMVLFLMVFRNWGGGRAGAAGWFTALIAAVLSFGAHPELIAYSQMKGVLLSLNVLYIIWAALLLYHVVNDTGAIEAIGIGIERFSGDKAIQLLIFGWVFGSFLQGVAGYGVPIAVVAPLLVGLGFNPVVAVAAPAIGHSWSVTFGSMGASFQALMAVTGLDDAFLASWSALLLGLSAYLCAIFAIHVFGGWKLVRHSAIAILIIGTVMAATQYVLAVSGMWTLGGFGASLMGMCAALMVARLKPYRAAAASDAHAQMSFIWAFSAYIILIVIVSAGELVGPVRNFLGQVRLSMVFPEIVSRTGWVTPAQNGKSINLFGHGGALLTYSAMASYLVFSIKGYYRPQSMRRILSRTVKSGVPTSLGIVSMVCFALIMDHCGMISILAEGISRVFGGLYPFFAPWIGLLGAFMTGSNTNSNVVFGVLQQQTAGLAGISTALILAAQTTGGALGSMVAPAKIIVGCSTVGLAGKEGPVLKATLRYGMVITGMIGLVTLAAAAMGL
ncbi:lactate permease [Desulfosarcina alkanivorans]|uniref:L-lactate permease n=1 Tax=Desulfosarcina alkanivorans TaxID=571177 RepID=A0A5K7Z318_9BACT|nr:L-lactate permease [Desulfosarcina alkanivorans]BBO71037.1 lactate permease [Desulfosarcina alkanivorans]